MRRRLAGSALSSKNYRTYLYGSLFSLVGIWIQRLAIGWHAWQLSESAFVVGLVAASQLLPVLILTPLFGVVVDRIKARSGSIFLNVVMMAVAGTLGIITLQGAMTINVLLALAFAHGVVVSAYTPTRLTLIPDLVRQDLFPSAVAISSIAFNLSRFAGPGLAGLVIAMWGLGWAYVINAVTYLPVLLSLGLLSIDHASKPKPSTSSYLEQLAEGFRYARDHPQIRQAILLSGISAFFARGVLELMPAIAALVFQGGSNVLAMLMSAAGAGAILASVLLSTRFIQVRTRNLIFAGSIGGGIALAGISSTENLYLGMAVVMLLGFSTTMVGVGSQALVQVRVDDGLRGRVMSLWTLVSMGSPALGGIVGGALTRDHGAQWTSAVFAIACFVLILMLSRRQWALHLARHDE